MCRTDKQQPWRHQGHLKDLRRGGDGLLFKWPALLDGSQLIRALGRQRDGQLLTPAMAAEAEQNWGPSVSRKGNGPGPPGAVEPYSRFPQ